MPSPSSPYHTDSLRLKAIRDKDVESDGKFFFAVKKSNVYCRPTCPTFDAEAIHSPSDLTYFVNPPAKFKPCANCNPDLPIKIDNLIIEHTVNTVNDSLRPHIRHFRSSSLGEISKRSSAAAVSADARRRNSISGGQISSLASGPGTGSGSQSVCDGDHARLVNEACMHIAAAAAVAAAQAVSQVDSGKVDKVFKTQRKKRRGGILGFKELAAKAGLSPWHFHRVFRSVTGLTPKAYGDACWDTVTSINPVTLKEQNKAQLVREETAVEESEPVEKTSEEAAVAVATPLAGKQEENLDHPMQLEEEDEDDDEEEEQEQEQVVVVEEESLASESISSSPIDDPFSESLSNIGEQLMSTDSAATSIIDDMSFLDNPFDTAAAVPAFPLDSSLFNTQKDAANNNMLDFDLTTPDYMMSGTLPEYPIDQSWIFTNDEFILT